MNPIKPELKSRPNNSDEKLFHQIIDAVCVQCPYSGSKNEEWMLYAQIVAPFMVSFVEWILKSADQDHVKKLYFLARDGQILWKIASELKKAGATDIECRYLLASRQALHLPGHLDITQSKEWILENTSHLAIATIAARLQIDPNTLSEALGANHKLSIDKNLTPAERNEISALLEQPSALRMIDLATQQAFNIASGYFRQEGLLSDQEIPIGLVDVGWHGRLQRSIENIFKKNNKSCSQVHGYYLALNDRLVFSGADADRLKAFMYAPSGPHKEKWILDHVEMIELLHAADHASTMHYVENGNGDYGAAFLPSHLNNGADFRHEAILAFLEQYAILRRRSGRPIEMGGAARSMKHFLQWPSRKQAKLFLKYEHSEHQDEQHPSPYVFQNIPLRYLIHGPINSVHGRWPEGSHALNCTLSVYRLLCCFVQLKRLLFGSATRRSIYSHSH